MLKCQFSFSFFLGGNFFFCHSYRIYHSWSFSAWLLLTLWLSFLPSSQSQRLPVWNLLLSSPIGLFLFSYLLKCLLLLWTWLCGTVFKCYFFSIWCRFNWRSQKVKWNLMSCLESGLNRCELHIICLSRKYRVSSVTIRLHNKSAHKASVCFCPAVTCSLSHMRSPWQQIPLAAQFLMFLVTNINCNVANTNTAEHWHGIHQSLTDFK